MTNSQKYLIGALTALLAVVICVFREDMFTIANRPGVTDMLNRVQSYGLGIFLMLFAWLLAKSLNVRWWVFIVCFVLWELLYVVVLNFGAGFLPHEAKLSNWINHFKKVALTSIATIQFNEENARYDNELFYTLKPGASRFRSFEFDNEYNINSLGVRDSDRSLSHPEVLFLGDSYTMGWGVEQEEAFPQVFGKVSGLKTLSTGVSSYGTAREYRMMNRVETDSLRAIVIQYCENDLEENSFYLQNNALGSRVREEYDVQVKKNKQHRKYYPFKYVKKAWIAAVDNLKSGKAPVSELSVDNSDYISKFYRIVEKIHELKNVPVIITYTGSFYTDPQVVREFEMYASKNNISNVFFVNMGEILDYPDYFFFDPHINAGGHKKVAEKIKEKVVEVLGTHPRKR